MRDGVSVEDLPPLTRALADVLVSSMSVPAGRVELEVQGGAVVYVWRHERIAASQLARFDRVDAAQLTGLLDERLRLYRQRATGRG